MEELIYDKLKKYTAQKVIPMHMPGHKRSNKLSLPLPYDIDITEIDGFDNLHNMQGILKERSINASKVFNVKSSYFLVNGSTGGILSAIYSQTNTNDKIIVARNSHKAIFNAIEIRQLQPIYLMPTFNEELGITTSYDAFEIEKLLIAHKDVKCVVLTSPTYEGVASDIERISKICHKYDTLLIVDEAHGAHLGFSEHFPKSARNLGADIVINSMHKTLPTLTQCAIAHICTDLVNVGKFEKALSMFETSSPSYIFISSIDYCVNLIKNESDKLFNEYDKNLNNFYNETAKLKNIKVLNLNNKENVFDYDKGKLIISTKNTNLSGADLANLLRHNYNIEIEMASTNYIIAMTSICDEKENFEILANALKEIDNVFAIKKNIDINKFDFIKLNLPNKQYEISSALTLKGNFMQLSKCVGQVSLEYVWAYPPGIPLLVPGEIITQELIEQLLALEISGIEVKSDYKKAPKQIFVKSK
ncbi:MAG: aminotransferase class V-fold PLP-dependent enzyme [Clostridia bacterium]|nr:aminotransferase class V-fold PLP-dependent enzyme [Clostridia bacterium]